MIKGDIYFFKNGFFYNLKNTNYLLLVLYLFFYIQFWLLILFLNISAHRLFSFMIP